jgi:hypothetical protein
MHYGPVEVSRHPPTRSRPATRSRTGSHSGLCQLPTGTKKGRGLVCGTQESDRTASPALATTKVCSGAVLHGSGCAKHQATGPLPQPGAAATAPGDDLVSRSQEILPRSGTYPPPTALPSNPFFNTHRRFHSQPSSIILGTSRANQKSSGPEVGLGDMSCCCVTRTRLPTSPFLGRSDYSRIADHPLATQLIYRKIVLLPLCDKCQHTSWISALFHCQCCLSGQYRAVQNCLYRHQEVKIAAYTGGGRSGKSCLATAESRNNS